MNDEKNLFYENERKANTYGAFCLILAAAVAGLMWLLNVLGFFIVDAAMMNVTMPVGIVLLLLPSFMIHILKLGGAYIKYVVICCFLLGAGVMSSALTIQLVLAWACPILLSCHYYSPRFTGFTLAGVLLCMLISVYAGLYFGVWDANMMRSSEVLYGAAERAEFIRSATAGGDNLLLRVFNFYYIPRAVICVVIYLVGMTLSKRTRGLLVRQNEITQEKQRIDTELNVAKQIQTSLLPCIFPAFPERDEFDIFASMNPAKEVGGDFYDFFMPDGKHLAVVIADVSGKGVPAALFMVIAKTLLKDHTEPESDLGEVFTEVNRLLCESNSEGLFVTAFEGVLDLSSGEFRFVNAGHETPYICRRGENFEPYNVQLGFVLAGMDDMKYTSGGFVMREDDKIFLYTDGVTEATDIGNGLYGKQRLGKILSECGGMLPQEIIRTVKDDINDFTGDAPQFDDITMLCLKYNGNKNTENN